MKQIPDFNNLKILVVGDVMLDRYWHGNATRISPEAPVPVIRVDHSEERPGGASNVALNVASLGAQATLIGLTGRDEASEKLQNKLSSSNVVCKFLEDNNFTTISKLRVISRHQQIIRLDFEDGFPNFDPKSIVKLFEQEAPQHNVIIFSDYNKGTLSEVSSMINFARKLNKIILVDPKGENFNKYRGATTLTPNLKEFEAVVGNCKSSNEIFEKGIKLINQLELESLLITKGEQGMTLINSNRDVSHMPAQSREVFDVTGAGDTVIAVLAAGLAAEISFNLAVKYANIAAGIVVGKLGTATASIERIQNEFDIQEGSENGIMNEEQLMYQIKLARINNEKIVMTNGCFDILHSGHIRYLEEAAKLGDKLIVAVNIDETVQKLKGSKRPINSLSNRMNVLSALKCVNWVVPFKEITPERLICEVKPDFLVKGGDNKIEAIPGRDCVINSGGEVKTLCYVEGISTSQIIDTIDGKNKD
tara:strand:- start:27550 stop:28980 length:1431 start_codon:yes stop_codon:yes gene_type:complete